MSAPRQLVLASGNRGKLAELQALLGDAGFELAVQADHGVDDIDETGLTFVENALLKARHAARATGLPTLGDDSGLCVDALDGAPGLDSARYAGAHGDANANIAKLILKSFSLLLLEVVVMAKLNFLSNAWLISKS